MTWNKKQLFCIKPYGIIRRILCIVIAVWFACSAVVMDYQEAKAAEIVAGYTAAQILESILLSFGISIFTADMISKGTSATWWDTDGSAALQPYYDDLEEEYEQQRFKVINGGGGDPDPSPTPEPGNTPIPFPTTAPVTGDIPTFKELVAPALAGGAAVINMTQGAWECMSKAVSSLWDKMLGRTDINIDSSDIDEDALNILSQSGFAYYQYRPYPYYQIKKFKEGSFYLIDSGWYFVAGSETYDKDKKGSWTSSYTYSKDEYVSGGYQNIGFTNIPRFSDYSEGLAWSEKVRANADKYKKENIWVHPDLQDTYKNNGKLEYPQQAPRPLQIPSGEQLADTVKKLNPEINPDYSPELAPNYIQELIQQLQKDPSTDPDPTTAPDPNPDPNPDPDPDVNPTGIPTPKPTGVPDSEDDVNPNDYATDLSKVFPFCIPFDLIYLLNVFDAEPVAPVFSFPFDLSLKNPFKKGEMILDVHETFEFDFSNLDSVIEIFRITETIGFVIGLMVITRNLIRG